MDWGSGRCGVCWWWEPGDGWRRRQQGEVDETWGTRRFGDIEKEWGQSSWEPVVKENRVLFWNVAFSLG